MNIPIGSDSKSIFHGVTVFPLVMKVKPMIWDLSKRFFVLRELKHSGKYVRLAIEIIRTLKIICEMKDIILNELPEPTIETAQRRNTKFWVRLWDRFFENEKSTNRLDWWRMIRRIHLLINDGDMYYYERIEDSIHEIYKAIQSGEYEMTDKEPRPQWWGHTPVCPVCGQRQGENKQVFADCPAEMHL